MVRKIIWSPTAFESFECLLFYFQQKTGSKKYSKSLNEQIKIATSRLASFPYLGKKTEHPSIRALIEGHYKILYQLKPDEIIILMVWDTRQNPDDLEISNLLEK
jgi:plasmid stabilization system protein ParE